jgi:lipoate-protein ligase A
MKKNLIFLLKKKFSFAPNIQKKASVFITKSTNIVFNLSTEEFLYEHNNIDKPILLLYQNDKNVVIGKHQNPWKECNINLMNDESVNLASIIKYFFKVFFP